MNYSSVKRFFIGEPLQTQKISEEKITKVKALAVLSSDALSSVAYATEEILIPLAAFSLAALSWSLPVALAITVLLIIVTASYRQTISVYNNGGGAYVVAKENLGVKAGLVAAASLLIDYVLTVAVSVAAAVGAFTSAFPSLTPFTVHLGLALIAALTLLNLRGVRESATIFALPTYIFIFSFYLLLAVGFFKILRGDAIAAAPILHETYPSVALFLILKAFSSGCAALTGIEAISNGVPSFKPPASQNAKTTMAWMAFILCTLFFGITALSHMYGIVPGLLVGSHETAISQLSRAVFGHGFFYYLVQISAMLILALAANTSYNGFPWLAAIVAKDRYLPRQFAIRGDKLVFSNAIIWLSMAAAILIVVFKGNTHALIPLYAFGVFMGFTLSQTGMVRHHLKTRQERWKTALVINLLGAISTFIVLVVVGITKFVHGTWIVVLLIPTVVFFCARIHKHYLEIGRELSLDGKQPPEKLEPVTHTVVIPISGIHRGVIEAIRYGMSISRDVRAVYVEIDSEAAERLQHAWRLWGQSIPLVSLKSPYRSVIRPLLEYIEDIGQTTNTEMITVVIPEFVTARWWHSILHNQTALVIKAALMFKRNRVVTSVRYHLRTT